MDISDGPPNHLPLVFFGFVLVRGVQNEDAILGRVSDHQCGILRVVLMLCKSEDETDGRLGGTGEVDVRALRIVAEEECPWLCLGDSLFGYCNYDTSSAFDLKSAYSNISTTNVVLILGQIKNGQRLLTRWAWD